jgi:hypothetical protein
MGQPQRLQAQQRRSDLLRSCPFPGPRAWAAGGRAAMRTLLSVTGNGRGGRFVARGGHSSNSEPVKSFENVTFHVLIHLLTLTS